MISNLQYWDLSSEYITNLKSRKHEKIVLKNITDGPISLKATFIILFYLYILLEVTKEKNIRLVTHYVTNFIDCLFL